MHFYASSVNTERAITDESLKTTVRNLFLLFLYSCFSATVNLLSYCIIVYYLPKNKVIIKQGYNARKVQKCTHLLYRSVLSLGGHVNTRRISKPEMGFIFHIEIKWNILVIGNYHVNYQNYQNLMLLTSSNTIRTLMYLFLFTNSAQSICNCN